MTASRAGPSVWRMQIPQSVSRRALLRTAVVGGGAALAAGLASPPAHAEDETSGSIELSAIPITYVSAPLNLQGEIKWSVTKRRTSTFSLTAVENRSTTLSVDRTVALPGFSASGHSFTQRASGTSATTAVTINSDEHLAVDCHAAAGTDGYATVADTGFMLLQKPKVFLSGNLSGFRWKLATVNTLMITSVRALEDPNDALGHRGLLGAQTIAAVRAMYPLTAANTSGRALGLAKPRYKFRGQIIVGPSSVPLTFDRTTTSGSTVTIKTTDTSLTTITKREGFENSIAGIITIRSMFEEGRSIEITTIGVQERTDVNIQTTGGSRLWNDRVGRFTWLYWDRLWKTLLVTDEGPITGGVGMVQGQVLDSAGVPVPNAFVALGDGELTYEGRCDASGRYTLSTPTRLAGGSYTVFSGDGATSVQIGATGTPTANIRVVDRTATGRPPSPYQPILE